ncbi:hypothetical protein Ae505Ps2_1330 [Pseudonocardia sp. Ae505_Ps2]|nr:hypothetical protein Ae505Ps2_1330 [Pseudonocardia sp. Ae505_Ps2]
MPAHESVGCTELEQPDQSGVSRQRPQRRTLTRAAG